MKPNQPTREYDVIVIGVGMGGVAAAIEAASHGSKTLIVEQSGNSAEWEQIRSSHPFRSFLASV